MLELKPALVPGDGGGAVHWALLREGVGKDAADWRQHGRWNRPLARNAELGDHAREFPAAIKPQAEFLQEITGQVRVVGALHAPESKPRFVLLEELERFLQLVHRRVKRRRQEIDR